jgi:hypothetical protein
VRYGFARFSSGSRETRGPFGSFAAGAAAPAVALELDEHLLLHRRLVLRLHHLEHRLVVLVVRLQPLQIEDELVLLLDDALVVHLVEVALLAELVPRPLRRRRDLLHLLDLGAHVLELVVELLVAQVDVGHRPHVARAQLALRLHPVPLALEHVERLAHLHLEQHVADEVVEHLRSSRDRCTWRQVLL